MFWFLFRKSQGGLVILSIYPNSLCFTTLFIFSQESDCRGLAGSLEVACRNKILILLRADFLLKFFVKLSDLTDFST